VRDADPAGREIVVTGSALLDDVVLLRDDESGLAVAHVTITDRIAAHVLAPRLDRALAAATSPDATTRLALRARALVRPAHRHALAARLLAVVKSAGRPRTRRTPTVPVDADVVRANQEALVDLARRVDTQAPVPARGVAQVALLLGDGSGPLYYGHDAAALRGAIERASEALDPLSDW
jgi:hypothetical protein